MSNKGWTLEEKELLKKYYGSMTIEELIKSHIPNRTKKGIQHMLGKLGLSQKRERFWNDYEDEILKIMKRSYCSDKQIAKVLGRSEKAISLRVSRLGLNIEALQDFDDSELIQQQNNYLKIGNLSVGSINELQVEASLLSRGYDVFKPYMDNHKIDYLIINELSVVKIQVKTGIYSKERKRFRCNLYTKGRDGEIIYYESSDVDFFIVICNGIDDFYVIPFSEGNGKSIFLYPHRKKRYRQKEVDFEIYKNTFYLINEKLNIVEPNQEE